MGGKKKNKNKGGVKDLKDVNDAIQDNIEQTENPSPRAEETKPAVSEKKEEIIEPKFEEAPAQIAKGPEPKIDSPAKEEPKKEEPKKEEPAPVKEEVKIDEVKKEEVKKEEPKKEEPKKEETPVEEEVSPAKKDDVDQQSSGFEVLDASIQKPDTKPDTKVEVKDDHIKETPSKDDESPKKRPNIVGIKGFSSENDQPEIESPMRKKKRGLDKLKIS